MTDAAGLASPAERRGLAGWPGLLLALGGGAAVGIAHPPFGVWPGIAGFAVLLHAIDAAPARRPLRAAFARGWIAGFAYFLVGTWWVGEAFMVDAAAHAWQAPFAVTLLPAGLGLFWGLAGLAYRLQAPPGARRVLVFAALFAVAEWLRGHVLTGFPWNLPGEAWTAGSAPSQAAALVGAYGLSFITLAIGAAAAVFATPGSLRAKTVTGVAALVALGALWGGGAWRLAHAHVGRTAVQLRIVQPNVPQMVKWNPDAYRGIVERYVRLTAAPSAMPPSVVIWPEAAIPAPADELFSPSTWTGRTIISALAPGQTLLAGAVRTEGPTYFNSLLALRRTAEGMAFLGVYDKHRLVPFGEYLPAEGLLTTLGLKKLTAVEGGFAEGPRPAPLSVEGLPRVQPLICYESLFPSLASQAGGRPAWIANVSNDAWFGQTSGPLQHLNLASYRAIEEGLPVVRATPTGVSAIIDPYGRIEASIPSGREGVIDAPLPAPIAPTPYTKWRDAPFWLLTVSGLACAWRRRRA